MTPEFLFLVRERGRTGFSPLFSGLTFRSRLHRQMLCFVMQEFEVCNMWWKVHVMFIYIFLKVWPPYYVFNVNIRSQNELLYNSENELRVMEL